jgi:hypothetical protein
MMILKTRYARKTNAAVCYLLYATINATIDNNRASC